MCKCARSRDRTGTAVKPRDFKSLVSTYSTIRAEGEDYTRCAWPGLKGRRESAQRTFPFIWSGRRVSNSRPIPWQGIALPTELLPQTLEARAGVEPTYTDLQSGA